MTCPLCTLRIPHACYKLLPIEGGVTHHMMTMHVFVLVLSAFQDSLYNGYGEGESHMIWPNTERLCSHVATAYCCVSIYCVNMINEASCMQAHTHGMHGLVNVFITGETPRLRFDRYLVPFNLIL